MSVKLDPSEQRMTRVLQKEGPNRIGAAQKGALRTCVLHGLLALSTALQQGQSPSLGAAGNHLGKGQAAEHDFRKPPCCHVTLLVRFTR